MKAILDQAIADVEQLQSNLYRVRITLGEIPNPAAWTDGAKTAIDGIKQSLDRVTGQIRTAQAELDGILAQRQASEKGIAILVEEMGAITAAIDKLRTSIETTTNLEAA
jgi:prefoldin subunit 5